MEILKEVKSDVKDIKKYLFEWWLEEKYTTKSEIKGIEEKVSNHQKIINRITWAIIMWVLTVAGGVIMASIKLL